MSISMGSSFFRSASLLRVGIFRLVRFFLPCANLSALPPLAVAIAMLMSMPCHLILTILGALLVRLRLRLARSPSHVLDNYSTVVTIMNFMLTDVYKLVGWKKCEYLVGGATCF